MNNVTRIRVAMHGIRLATLRLDHAVTHTLARVQEFLSSWAEDMRLKHAPKNFGPISQDSVDKAHYYDRLSQSFLQASRDKHRRCEFLLNEIRIAEETRISGVLYDTTYEQDVARYYAEAEPTAFGN